MWRHESIEQGGSGRRPSGQERRGNKRPKYNVGPPVMQATVPAYFETIVKATIPEFVDVACTMPSVLLHARDRAVRTYVVVVTLSVQTAWELK
jgi:hypothetical protein